MDQQHDRHTPHLFEGPGRTSRVNKVRVKCLGKCQGTYFWSETKFNRMCPGCLKYARKMGSSMA